MSRELARDLARAIKDTDPPSIAPQSQFRTATVTAVSANAVTCTIQFADGVSVAGVTRLLSYNLPQVNDIVRVEQYGPALLITGRVVASSATGDQLAFRSPRVIISNDADTNPAQVALCDTKSGQATPNKYLRSVGGKFEVVNSAYNAVLFAISDSGQMTLPTTVPHTMGSLEIGQQGVSNTPYIDFHSGATNVDYDTRIIATGGTGTTGRGTLRVESGKVEFGPNDSGSEGGQLDLIGAGSYTTASVDNYQGNLRLLTSGGHVYLDKNSGGILKHDDGSPYVRSLSSHTKMQAGQVSISTTSGGGPGTASATIDYTDFSATPRVVVSIASLAGGAKYILRVSSISSTQATVTIYTGDGSNYTSTTSVPVDWIAVRT